MREIGNQSVLEPEQWLARARDHAVRVAGFVAPHAERARVGEPHPVWDFLFSYYSLRPGQLRCWHPGYGVTLTGDEAIRRYRDRRGYAVAGAAATDTVVEAEIAGPLRCSHFDAFRFFTADAAPRNAGKPRRDTQHDWEQPGCLHANMDLYKWSYKLSPLIDSETLLACLELAAAAREIDMRASPYDLSGYGYTPIAVEDAAGRAEYVRCQKDIATRAQPLRAALLERCDLLLQVAGGE